MASAHREYGSDEYWITRHGNRKKRKRDDDVTDEWLLSWETLQPLLADCWPSGASVLDLGCGTSPLALDLVHDTDARVHAIDIAPGAVQHQQEEQRARRARGDKTASRASFDVVDVTRPGSLGNAAYDACIDKSTTDGLLCDTKGGAERVRSMYVNVGAALRPDTVVAVCSWRDPDGDEGLEWLVDVVFGGLQAGAATQPSCPSPYWTLDAHTFVSCSGVRGPHVYVLRRRSLRRSSRIQSGAAEEGDGDAVEAAELRMRCHLHEEVDE